MNNTKRIEEILKLNGKLIEYLSSTKFNVFQAEGKKNELIQYLFNNNGFYSQNKNRITSDEYNLERITSLLDNILSNYKSAVSFISQRKTSKSDVEGRPLTDWDFYVAIKTKVVDNCEEKTLEINDIINRKKTK